MAKAPERNGIYGKYGSLPGGEEWERGKTGAHPVKYASMYSSTVRAHVYTCAVVADVMDEIVSR